MKKFLNNIEDNICAIILLAMTILTCVNVFARYVFLSSMPFVEELTPMGLVVLSIVGAAVAAKKGAHLGLTVITDLLSPKYQKLCVLFAHALGFIFGIIILYYGLDTVRVEYLLEFVTSGMQWPEWIFGITIPLGGFILAVRYLQLFITEPKK